MAAVSTRYIKSFEEVGRKNDANSTPVRKTQKRPNDNVELRPKVTSCLGHTLRQDWGAINAVSAIPWIHSMYDSFMYISWNMAQKGNQ